MEIFTIKLKEWYFKKGVKIISTSNITTDNVENCLNILKSQGVNIISYKAKKLTL